MSVLFISAFSLALRGRMRVGEKLVRDKSSSSIEVDIIYNFKKRHGKKSIFRKRQKSEETVLEVMVAVVESENGSGNNKSLLLFQLY